MADNDLNDALLGFTNYVMNERVRCYNEGADAGRITERNRCAKIAENEIGPDDDDHTRAAQTIRSYIVSGGTPAGLDE